MAEPTPGTDAFTLFVALPALLVVVVIVAGILLRVVLAVI